MSLPHAVLFCLFACLLAYFSVAQKPLRRGRDLFRLRDHRPLLRASSRRSRQAGLLFHTALLLTQGLTAKEAQQRCFPGSSPPPLDFLLQLRAPAQGEKLSVVAWPPRSISNENSLCLHSSSDLGSPSVRLPSEVTLSDIELTVDVKWYYDILRPFGLEVLM